MTRYEEDDRYRGRRPDQDARSGAAVSDEERARMDRDHHAGRSDGSDSQQRLARGSGAQAPHSPEHHQGNHDSGRNVRDHSRGQHRSGGYDPYDDRDYRHGGGYGGYGEAPGEAAGGLDSGRHYSAEPGWGPGYGARGNSRSHWPEGEGNQPHGRDPQAPDRDPARFDPTRGYTPSSQDRERPSSYWGRPGRGGMPPAPRYGLGPKGYQRSDERLKEDICERLMWRGEHIDVSEVSIDVKEGNVTLEGAVPERRMKHAIEDIVDECMGVKEIENRIRVTYGEHRHVHAERPNEARDTRASVGAGPGNSATVSGIDASSDGRSD